MNKYQSHKIVDAARILRFDASKDAEGEVCYDIDLEGEDEVFVVTAAIGNRLLQMAADADTTVINGQLMLYPDAYISWSPRAQFDGGYDLLQPTSGKSQIAGYRELNAGEVAAINDVKGVGKMLGDFIDIQRADEECDQRWVSIGATELQKGLMSLTRAIAKPDFF